MRRDNIFGDQLVRVITGEELIKGPVVARTTGTGDCAEADRLTTFLDLVVLVVTDPPDTVPCAAVSCVACAVEAAPAAAATAAAAEDVAARAAMKEIGAIPCGFSAFRAARGTSSAHWSTSLAPGREGRSEATLFHAVSSAEAEVPEAPRVDDAHVLGVSSRSTFPQYRHASLRLGFSSSCAFFPNSLSAMLVNKDKWSRTDSAARVSASRARPRPPGRSLASSVRVRMRPVRSASTSTSS